MIPTILPEAKLGSSHPVLSASSTAVGAQLRSVTFGLPLYLTSPGRLSIHAMDTAAGGSLVVQSADTASRLFPIAHLSRIVSSLRHNWDGAALTLCLRSSVPVIFIENGRGLAGWLSTANPAPTRLAALLQELLSLYEWSNIYSNWLRAERNRALRAWPRTAFPGDFVTESEDRKRFVYQAGSAATPPVPELWNVASLALAIQTLHAAGLDAIYAGSDGRMLNLAHDCSNILALHLVPYADGLIGTLQGAEELLLHGFESRSAELSVALFAALGRLHRLCVQEMNQCR